MYKRFGRLINSHIYTIVGIFAGIYCFTLLGSQVPHINEFRVCPVLEEKNGLMQLSSESSRPSVARVSNAFTRRNGTAVPPDAQKRRDVDTKPIRPRYYSTELGIRDKLFVGILTSEQRIHSQAVHLNRTMVHLVDRLRFFLSARYKVHTHLNVSGLVGLTDTKSRFRPFQIIKYVADTYGKQYDFYFFANDYTFVDGRKLRDLVKSLSVSMDVYLGVPVVESSFCNLDAGILFSNSVLMAMRQDLDWCVHNAIVDDHSENLGRCVYHSTGGSLACQQQLQNQSIHSYRIRHFSVAHHMSQLAGVDTFNAAHTVYPVLDTNDFYILNSYFLRKRLESVQTELDRLSKLQSVDGDVPWPAGSEPGARPATRFDLARQYYFNMTHILFPDDYTVARLHSQAEQQDLSNVIDAVRMHIQHTYPAYRWQRLVNGYRTFDMSRGMDYVLDVALEPFPPANSHQTESIKRFQVSKPLSRSDVVPMPFVTESSRVSIIVCVRQHQQQMALESLHNTILPLLTSQRRAASDAIFILYVLLYSNEMPSKGLNDTFFKLKQELLTFKQHCQWLSIRLPAGRGPPATQNVIDFVIADLALRKIGLDSIALLTDAHARFNVDFINRVRINTINGCQVFAVIPFRQYDNNVMAQCETLSNMRRRNTSASSSSVVEEVSKVHGRFDASQWHAISFYGRDYVRARRQLAVPPIVRADAELEAWWRPSAAPLAHDILHAHTIVDMFVRYARHLHVLRATDAHYHLLNNGGNALGNDDDNHLFLASNVQLGRLILSKRDIIFHEDM